MCLNSEGYTDTPSRIYSKWTLEDEFSQYDEAVIRIYRQNGKAEAYSLVFIIVITKINID
jgi:hypothetical protein